METGFLRNGWYAAAWSDEIGNSLIERNILGRSVVLFRQSDGTITALEGTCPHRSYPLVLGSLKDDRITCGYHGLVFNCQGECESVLAGHRVPSAMKLHAYRLVERGGMVWLWPGVPDRADERLIPEHWLGEPGWRSVSGVKMVECNASLLLENVMDLTHETYLHPTTLGQDAIADTPMRVEVYARGVTASRTMPDVAAPGFFAALGLTGRIDRGQIAEYAPPRPCHHARVC